MEEISVEEEVTAEYGHRMSTWPVFWGVVAIIFGVVGLLIQGVKAMQSFGFMMMPKDFYKEVYENAATSKGDPQLEKVVEVQGDMMASMIEWAPLSLTASLALSIVALVLIVGGIMLCARKRIASPTLQTWAYLKIIAGGFGAWVGFNASSGILGGYGDAVNSIAASSSGGAPPSGMPNVGGIMEMMAMVGAVISIIWMLLLPIFFLCWFNRPAVKEDMKHGQGW